MEREFINPPDLANPPNNIYNHVVKVGNTVYISGQVSRDLAPPCGPTPLDK